MDTQKDNPDVDPGTVGQVLNMVAGQNDQDQADESEAAGASDTTVVMEPADVDNAAGEQDSGQEPLPDSISLDTTTTPELLVARIDELTRQVAKAEEARLRSLAEVDNIQKRFDKVRSDASRYGGVPLARDLLVVVDAIDRLEASVDDEFRGQSPSFVEGVELIGRLLMETFERHQIKVINPQKGESLDIERHESMFKEADDTVEAGQVVRVLEKGFLYQDRLLRPARVSIADQMPIDGGLPQEPDVQDRGSTA